MNPRAVRRKLPIIFDRYALSPASRKLARAALRERPIGASKCYAAILRSLEPHYPYEPH